MKVRLVDPMQHPLLCYPGTSTPLRAVGLRADGSPLWPLLGADGEDDDGDDEGEDGDAEEEDDPEEDADADDNDSDDGKKGKSKKRTGPVSRDEFDAVTRRLSAADKRRSEAEKTAAALQKEKDDAERKGKPELDNLRKDHGELTKAHESLQTKFRTLALVNAFLTASAQEKIAWHNPRVAQNAAADELKDLEVDDDGQVEGIRDVVKALAKANKYLVNTGKESDDEEDGEKRTVRRGASGSGVGSTKTAKGKKTNGTLSDEELRRRFPALGRPR